MKRISKILIPALALSLAAAGCVDEQDEVETIAAAIELDNGGLTMEDEAPMFGTPDLYEEADFPEELYTDPMDSDPVVQEMSSSPDAMAYYAVVAWGQMPINPANPQERIWTGSLNVNRGAIVVHKTVRFDDYDSLEPRTDRKVVEFTSRTRPAFDALRVLIIDPTPDAAEPLTLTFTTDAGPEWSKRVDALVAGPTSTVVDAANNRIAGMAVPRAVDVCNYGFIHGRWNKLADGLGRFIGRVVDFKGELKGHIRGIWGKRNDGSKVFFGKYIRADGTFRGIFGGHYDSGAFEGRWHNRSGELGGLMGEYREAAVGGQGHFMARWQETSCNLQLP